MQLKWVWPIFFMGVIALNQLVLAQGTKPSPSGQGAVTVPKGEEYVGEFKDGKRNGQGTLTFSWGGKYIGEFKDGKPNGKGTFTFPEGGNYVGEIKDDKMHGQGTLTTPEGFKYVGEFADDKPTKGTLTLASGETYAGEFKYDQDGKPMGQITHTLPDGRKYVGEINPAREYHGQGIEYRADGSILRSGNWENGVFTGDKAGGYKATPREGSGLQAPTTRRRPSASVMRVTGTVEVKSGLSAWRPARSSEDLVGGDFVRTANDGTATLLLADKTQISISRNSMFEIKAIGDDSTIGKAGTLSKGRPWTQSRPTPGQTSSEKQ